MLNDKILTQTGYDILLKNFNKIVRINEKNVNIC
jgi:hypothetical protein